MGQLIVLLSFVAVAATFTACAATDPGGEAPERAESSSAAASPSASRSEPPMSSSNMLPTITPPSSPPTTPGHVFKPLTVSGVVVQGIHAGCVELVTANNLRYVLVSSQAKTFTSGQQVILRGLPAPHRESSCTGVVLQVLGLPERPP